MAFAGVDPAEATDAVEQETGAFEVPSPPPTPRSPLGR
jgi:hypothetical protein